MVTMVTLLSCGKNANGDVEEILNFMQENGISYVDTLGVLVHIQEQGTDIYPKETNTVEISYEATYLNGEVFDKSPEGRFVRLNLNNTIKGLKNGLLVISKNTRGSIYIPSSQGYGANPPFGIRKNAILVYHVYVNDIIK